jgi:uncharacterized protein (DUF2384 family)
MPATQRVGRRLPKRQTMAPDAIRRLREDKLRMPRSAFARLIETTENTVFRWETGTMAPDPHANEAIEHLNQVCDILEPSLPPSAVGEWLQRPNRAIDNFRPVDLIAFEYGRRKLRALIEEIGLDASPLQGS